MNKLLIISSSNDQNHAIRLPLYKLLRPMFGRVCFIGESEVKYDSDTFINWNGAKSRRKTGILIQLYALYKILRFYRPSHVISFSPKCNLFCSILASVFRFKHAMVISGFGQLGNVIKRNYAIKFLFTYFASKRNTNVIVMNLGDMEYLCDHANIENVEFISGEGYSMQFDDVSASVRDRDYDYIFVSRIIEEKGVFDFLEAIKILKDKGFSAKAVLAGPMHLTKREIERFKYLLQEVDAEYKGYLSDSEKNNLLLNSKVLVLPSYYGEGLPFILLEGQDAGCEVLTTKTPGCIDACYPKPNIQFITKDTNHLADLMSLSLENFNKFDPEETKKIRCWLEENFSVERVMEQYYTILNRNSFIEQV